jgi:hypothetical protein
MVLRYHIDISPIALELFTPVSPKEPYPTPTKTLIIGEHSHDSHAKPDVLLQRCW